jgi:hypothetical protein
MHGTPNLLDRPTGTLGDLFGNEAAPGQAPERSSLGFRRQLPESQLFGSMHRVLLCDVSLAGIRSRKIGFPAGAFKGVVLRSGYRLCLTGGSASR